jgi:hypothetical protein
MCIPWTLRKNKGFLEFFFVSDAVVGTEEIMMKELVKTPCP